MHANGVSDYPDPLARSPPSAPTKFRTTYLGNCFGRNAPTFQADERACQNYAAGFATRATPVVAGKVQAEQLRYAVCMRTHGVPDFPDPSANGGFRIPNSVDQNSSFFEAGARVRKNFWQISNQGT